MCRFLDKHATHKHKLNTPRAKEEARLPKERAPRERVRSLLAQVGNFQPTLRTVAAHAPETRKSSPVGVNHPPLKTTLFVGKPRRAWLVGAGILRGECKSAARG